MDPVNQFGDPYNTNLPGNFWTNPCSSATDPLAGPDGQYLVPNLPDYTVLTSTDPNTFNACPLLGPPVTPPPVVCDGVPGHPGCPDLKPVSDLKQLGFNPGTLASAPASNRLLVYAPSCFWIGGEQNTGAARLEIQPGNPEYVYKVQFDMSSVTWDYGDGSPPTDISGTDGLGDADPNDSCLSDAADPVRHSYGTVSGTAARPDQPFTVTATEHLGIDAWAYTCIPLAAGGANCGPVEQLDVSHLCPPGFHGQDLGCVTDSVLTEAVTVGQIEAVPTA